MKKLEFQSEWQKDSKNGLDCEIRAKSQRLMLTHSCGVSFSFPSHIALNFFV